MGVSVSGGGIEGEELMMGGESVVRKAGGGRVEDLGFG